MRIRRGLFHLLAITSLLAVNLTFASTVLAAQPAATLEQCRNGLATAPNDCLGTLGGNAGWVSGNVGQSQAHLVEGYSIPYRAILTDLPLNTSITLVLGYDIKHSDKNAIDYLTQYQRLEPHAQFGHPAEVVNPTSGVSGVNATIDTTPIDPPSSLNSPVAGQPTTSFNNLVASEGQAKAVMTLFGGQFDGPEANKFQYVSQGSLTAAQSETTISVTFKALSSTVVLAWGGHIASRLDWGFTNGVPNSAGGVSGGGSRLRGGCSSWVPGPPARSSSRSC